MAVPCHWFLNGRLKILGDVDKCHLQAKVNQGQVEIVIVPVWPKGLVWTQITLTIWVQTKKNVREKFYESTLHHLCFYIMWNFSIWLLGTPLIYNMFLKQDGHCAKKNVRWQQVHRKLSPLICGNFFFLSPMMSLLFFVFPALQSLSFSNCPYSCTTVIT